MIKLQNLEARIADERIEVSGNKIQQTKRNELKADILDTLEQVFFDANFQTHRNDDGVVLVFQSKNLEFHVALDAVIKNLDYDIDFRNDEYQLKLEKRAERERIRKEKAERKAKEKSE